uniref:Uncharacterized protein n=1 Tax=Apteryx owenii TaxID=8824 RepID=A0A8B9S5G6_APTOW
PGAHRAGVEAEAREHGAGEGGEGAAADGGLLDEGAQAAVVVRAGQVDHARQVGQEVAELLLHLLAAELVVGVLQVVVRDEVGAARQLRGASVELWSGIGKGPPRKLKFPEPAAVAEALKRSLA